MRYMFKPTKYVDIMFALSVLCKVCNRSYTLRQKVDGSLWNPFKFCLGYSKCCSFIAMKEPIAMQKFITLFLHHISYQVVTHSAVGIEVTSVEENTAKLGERCGHLQKQ